MSPKPIKGKIKKKPKKIKYTKICLVTKPMKVRF
jgi:hypothetical protein